MYMSTYGGVLKEGETDCVFGGPQCPLRDKACQIPRRSPSHRGRLGG